MTNVLVVGASGQISKEAIDLYLEKTDFDLTLFLRDESKLPAYDSDRISVIEGDATDKDAVEAAVEGMDVVFVSSTGDTLGTQAQEIVNAMEKKGVERLIFVTALHIYDEVPGKFGKWNDENIGPYLGPFREAADIIEASSLNYTILRPAWLTNYDEVEYETTAKGEPFKGTEVSRKSVADLSVDLSKDSSLHSRESIGMNKPNTDGDKPDWM
ncbi:SDR family oxidoreductase [Corticicoccus populi]|uniref:SDR family oxidoreductase n=1 Tax=Corticicoccus populi TaxID=1812821 RepID=A0ABW5WVQ2_9STAP